MKNLYDGASCLIFLGGIVLIFGLVANAILLLLGDISDWARHGYMEENSVLDLLGKDALMDWVGLRSTLDQIPDWLGLLLLAATIGIIGLYALTPMDKD